MQYTENEDAQKQRVAALRFKHVTAMKQLVSGSLTCLRNDAGALLSTLCAVIAERRVEDAG